MNSLDGRRVAFIASPVGVEKAELEDPWDAVEDAGGTAVLITPDRQSVQSVVGDTDKDLTIEADLATDDADVDDYAGLVIPGGTLNADKVRADDDMVELVKAFVDAGKPVAAICHGPWALVEAGVLPGKTLTSYPSLRTDITNAGGTWVDSEVQVCTEEGWTLVTSRSPKDLDAFCVEVVERFSSP